MPSNRSRIGNSSADSTRPSPFNAGTVRQKPRTAKALLPEETMNVFDKTLRRPPTDPNAPPRVEPLTPPFAADSQAVFDRIMPPGAPPLALFTTLARDARLFERLRGGSLLDKGHLTLRQREVVIDRVTALSGSEYEWGVHVAFFAKRVGLDEAM